MISFFAEGKAIPQGSMKFIRPGVMIHARAAELASWRALIAYRAKEAGCHPIEGPICIKLRFQMRRPKTVKRTYPTVAPDADKLLRACCDALTGVAYVDDAQIVRIMVEKVYGSPIGVHIEVSDGFDVL